MCKSEKYSFGNSLIGWWIQLIQKRERIPGKTTKTPKGVLMQGGHCWVSLMECKMRSLCQADPSRLRINRRCPRCLCWSSAVLAVWWGSLRRSLLVYENCKVELIVNKLNSLFWVEETMLNIVAVEPLTTLTGRKLKVALGFAGTITHNLLLSHKFSCSPSLIHLNRLVESNSGKIHVYCRCHNLFIISQICDTG